jgi:hypothetical protein
VVCHCGKRRRPLPAKDGQIVIVAATKAVLVATNFIVGRWTASAIVLVAEVVLLSLRVGAHVLGRH